MTSREERVVRAAEKVLEYLADPVRFAGPDVLERRRLALRDAIATKDPTPTASESKDEESELEAIREAMRSVVREVINSPSWLREIYARNEAIEHSIMRREENKAHDTKTDVLYDVAESVRDAIINGECGYCDFDAVAARANEIDLVSLVEEKRRLHKVKM